MNTSAVMPVEVEVEEVMVPEGSDSNHRESEVYRDSYLGNFNNNDPNSLREPSFNQQVAFYPKNEEDEEG